MPKVRHLSDSEVLDKVRDDDKVHAAIDDYTRAILRYGEDNVSDKNLKAVIAWRIAVWSEHEVEEEGLDGDSRYCESGVA